MEDVVAGKLLAGPSSSCTGLSSHHVLSADDADAVCGGKVFSSSIGVQSVHVPNGSPRHDDIMDSFLERPHSQVHGPGGKEREGMNLDHDGNKRCVKEHLDKTHYEVSVQHVHSFVFPWILTL